MSDLMNKIDSMPKSYKTAAKVAVMALASLLVFLLIRRIVSDLSPRRSAEKIKERWEGKKDVVEARWEGKQGLQAIKNEGKVELANNRQESRQIQAKQRQDTLVEILSLHPLLRKRKKK